MERPAFFMACSMVVQALATSCSVVPGFRPTGGGARREPSPVGGSEFFFGGSEFFFGGSEFFFGGKLWGKGEWSGERLGDG